jgi:hypothetical protein
MEIMQVDSDASKLVNKWTIISSHVLYKNENKEISLEMLIAWNEPWYMFRPYK